MSKKLLLEITNLRKSWADTKTHLDVPNFKLHNKQILLVTGDNGSGKTTLLKILAGFIQADTGIKILWQDNQIQKLDIGIHTCMLHQHPYLFKRSVKANLEFVLKHQPTSTANSDELLAQIGLSHLGSRHVNLLSGGEQRRLAIIRTFASNAPVLLFDEPFNDLDETSIQQFCKLLNTATSNKQSIVIATPKHNIPTQLENQSQLNLELPATN